MFFFPTVEGLFVHFTANNVLASRGHGLLVALAFELRCPPRHTIKLNYVKQQGRRSLQGYAGVQKKIKILHCAFECHQIKHKMVCFSLKALGIHSQLEGL